MKKLQLPSSYAALSPEEQCAAFGGSEFGDAVGSFFDNLHFNDFFWNGGLISFSFTFVPMLLFRVIKTGVQTGIKPLSRSAACLASPARLPSLPSSTWIVRSSEMTSRSKILSPSFFLFSNKL